MSDATNTTETATQPAGITCYMLEYDVRVGTTYTDAQGNTKPFPNPSGFMRRIGFRATLSCWVIPEHALPYNYINTMRSIGCEVNLVKFDASEGPRLIQMAIDKIKKELASARAAAAKSLDGAADKNLHDSEIPGERDTGESRFERAAQIVLNRYNRLVKDVEMAIANFGVSPQAIGVADARAAHELFQAGITARCEAYATATRRLRDVGTADATAMAATAARDEVPVYAVEDMLRDAGHEGAADELKAAFAAPSDEETVPPDGDDDTFSLADHGGE